LLNDYVTIDAYGSKNWNVSEHDGGRELWSWRIVVGAGGLIL
jgi:hypothetical protein